MIVFYYSVKVSVKLPSKQELTVIVPLAAIQVEYYKKLLSGLDKDTVEVVMKESSPAGIASSSNSLDVPSSGKYNGVEDGDATASATTSGVSGEMKSEKDISSSGSESTWRRLLNLLIQLRKLCNHVYLMPDAAPFPYEVDESIVTGSGKLKLLDRMLPKLREDGHRVLIFSQFTSTLDILEDYCEYRKLPFVRLDGYICCCICCFVVL